MKHAIIQRLITDYKSSIEIIFEEENYKWKAFKCFEKNWDDNEPIKSFSIMLRKALAQSYNLLNTKNNLSGEAICDLAEADSAGVKILFAELYNNEIDVYERIKQFKSNVTKLWESNMMGKTDQQSYHSITVYLSFRFPELYYIYLNKSLLNYLKYAGMEYLYCNGIAGIRLAYMLMDSIKYNVEKDEIIEQHKNLLNPSEHFMGNDICLLVQDIMYSTWHFTESDQPGGMFKVKDITVKPWQYKELKQYKASVATNGKKTEGEYTSEQKDKKALGDAGEFFVYNREISLRKGTKYEKMIEYTT